MTTPVLVALRTKRAEIAQQVHDTERKLAKLRAALANLDAAMNILTPEHPDHIAPRRHPRRGLYFADGELSRLVRERLRDAAKPLSAGEIAAGIIAAKSFPEANHVAVTKMIVARLGALTKRGELVKTGVTRNARWVVS
jgi:hypothetical protein